MFNKSGWPMSYCQYLGKNFFLVKFHDPTHKNDALNFAPWFFGRNSCTPFQGYPFHVTIGNYNFLLAWVKFPFKFVTLESTCFKLARSLGEVLLFIRGNKRSIFPNDKAYIVWDLWEPIAKSIWVCLSKSISI